MEVGRRAVLGALCFPTDAPNPGEERGEAELQLSVNAARGMWGSWQLFLEENLGMWGLGMRGCHCPDAGGS